MPHTALAEEACRAPCAIAAPAGHQVRLHKLSNMAILHSHRKLCSGPWGGEGWDACGAWPHGSEECLGGGACCICCIGRGGL